MSNHFCPPGAKPAPATEQQTWELAGQTIRCVAIPPTISPPQRGQT